MIRHDRFIRFSRLSVAALLVGSISGALAEDKPAHEPTNVATEAANTAPKTAREEIKAFCSNIADAARDQRYLNQKEELTALQKKVDERISVLEKRRVEYEDWVKQRNKFAEMAQAGLVDIYKKMKPDAAATQLNLVDPNLASAIVMKLTASQSSLILAEMEPKKAAALTAIISAASTRNPTRNPS